MTMTRSFVGLIILMIGTMPTMAAQGRPGSGFPDSLITGAIVVNGQDKERQLLARSVDALVEATPTFTPGYLVGVAHSEKGWRLIGRGSQATVPSPMGMRESSCSRPIEVNIGQKLVALWGKALTKMSGKSDAIGLDGEFFTFSIKGGNVGQTWSPDPRDQPKMFRLTKIADGMFDACLTGRDLDKLEHQIAELLALM